jgi:hypothetical protein
MKFTPAPLFNKMVLFYSQNKHRENPASGRRELPKIYNNGSSRCFHADTLVVTPSGNRRISELSADDMVISYNHITNEKETKRVTDLTITRNHNKKCYAITMKDGSVIRCTSDHKFYFNGEYVEIGKILSK